MGLHPHLVRHTPEAVQEMLTQAIAQHRIAVHYQAQNDLRDGQLIGFEALCRLNGSPYEQLSPDTFIPVAETSGLIMPLEQQVLAQIAQDLPLLLSHHPQARVSLNISTRHMADPGFFADFQDWLAKLPAPCIRQLDFEITETYLQQISTDMLQGLHALRRAGVRVVMDDFGAGQSSLARLHTLPFDVIKLDKQFVQQIHHPMVHAIVKAAVEFTQQFELGLMAEGVETQAQCETLMALGCYQVQGFFFGKPAPLQHWLSTP